MPISRICSAQTAPSCQVGIGPLGPAKLPYSLAQEQTHMDTLPPKSLLPSDVFSFRNTCDNGGPGWPVLGYVDTNRCCRAHLLLVSRPCSVHIMPPSYNLKAPGWKARMRNTVCLSTTEVSSWGEISENDVITFLESSHLTAALEAPV